MIAVITGASSGIGFEVAKSLKALNYRLVLVGRDRSRHAPIRGEGDEFVECELARLRSVAAAATTIRASHQQIDLLINNAGIAGRRGVTEDGFELAFGVNYLSHYLLTRLLEVPGRVVNVSSEAHRSVKQLDPARGLGRTRTLVGWKEYQFSKAAQIAFTQSLARRGTFALAAHPGVISTNLWRAIPVPFRGFFLKRMLPPVTGAVPIMRAATDQSLRSGDYVTPKGIIAPTSLTTKPSVAERLWEQSEKWVAPYLS